MGSIWLHDLPEVLRSAGLKVITVDGWERRGHDGFSGMKTVSPHHTAGPSTGNMPSLNVVTFGRSDLPGPLCNVALARDGTCYVVAAGVAYHAGTVRDPSFGNWYNFGIEAEATGVSSHWPDVQMEAYALLCATVERVYLKVRAGSRTFGHKEICSPAGRKIDPNFDMRSFRTRVAVAGEKDWITMASEEDLKSAVEGAIPNVILSVRDDKTGETREVSMQTWARWVEEDLDRIKKHQVANGKMLKALLEHFNLPSGDVDEPETAARAQK